MLWNKNTYVYSLPCRVFLCENSKSMIVNVYFHSLGANRINFYIVHINIK